MACNCLLITVCHRGTLSWAFRCWYFHYRHLKCAISQLTDCHPQLLKSLLLLLHVFIVLLAPSVMHLSQIFLQNCRKKYNQIKPQDLLIVLFTLLWWIYNLKTVNLPLKMFASCKQYKSSCIIASRRSTEHGTPSHLFLIFVCHFFFMV